MMQNTNFKITKKSGEIIPFDVEKLRTSFIRSGANEKDIHAVLAQLADFVHEGISTRKLFKLAYGLLRKKSIEVAGRYRLKNAIMELGPTGYPFEKYVGELLKYQGFDVEVGTIVNGECITHEIDVIAWQNKKKLMVECKYHANTQTKSDVKVALYIHSRFNDVVNAWKKNDQNKFDDYEAWVITNTRFTEDAESYARCAGLNLISWDYPSQGSLRERIDISGLYPITALQTISKREKQILMEKGIVLCKSITADNLKEMSIVGNRARKILHEAFSICTPK